MSIIYPYLKDTQFLQDFDHLRIKEQYVKITVLDFQEKPLQEIQGQVVSGSINLDGQSTVRRTCNLTFIADTHQANTTDINNLLSINKKIKLEVGFINNTTKYLEYKKIWFPLGVYLIINPSISNSNSGIQISLQLKDKMCQLNGECGGVIPAAVDFANMEEYDEKGNLIKLKPTIYQIIQELVHHYGGEQEGKILIDGLDKKVKQVVKWQGNKPLYYYEKRIDNNIDLLARGYTTNSADVLGSDNRLLPNVTYYKEYNLGEDIGYQLVDFIYPDELAADAGATVVSVLDTIKDKLGNFEYFYDLDGNFVFQEIKNFLNTTEATTILNARNNLFKKSDTNMYLLDQTKGKTAYRFSNKNIITSYTNTPQYNMIKNDFVVWGARKTIDGLEFPIRYHLALDTRPVIEDKIYEIYFERTQEGYDKPFLPQRVFSKDDFIVKSAEEFSKQLETLVPATERTPDAYFVYQYYKIYNDQGQPIGPLQSFILKWDFEQQKLILNPNHVDLVPIKINDWRSQLFIQGLMARGSGQYTNDYYAELVNEWPKLYDLKAHAVKENGVVQYYIGDFRQDTLEKFTTLDYFLDIIEPSSQIGNLNVSQIGRRTKVLNDNSINCIFEPVIPDYVLIRGGGGDETAQARGECIKRGLKYLQVDDYILEGLGKGGHYNSAFYAIQDLLYQHTSYNESITINCLPIFYLHPNTRIFVSDKRSGIYGDYIIKSLSLPLDVNGTMSINANRALDKI